MVVLRQIGMEASKALAVLALIFLAFVPHPASSAPHSTDLLAVSQSAPALSYCGGDPDDDGARHGPCHGCRSSVAALPDAPMLAVPAFVVCAAFAADRTPEAVRVIPTREPLQPRAPPMAT